MMTAKKLQMKLIFVLSLIFIAACNNPGDKMSSVPGGDSSISSTNTDSTGYTGKPAGADTSIAGCYSYAKNRDTISVELEMKGGNLAGPVVYNFYQKDRNDGTFQGEISGGTITGWYLFKSEGVMSVRQEIWKLAKGKLIPALGDRFERGDSSFFKDPSIVRFDSSMALTKIPCVI